MKIPRKKSSKPHDGKSLIRRQKFDKSTKVDKATKGEQIPQAWKSDKTLIR